MVQSLLALLLCVTVNAGTAHGTEYEFVATQDDRGAVTKFVESLATVITAYHVQATPHEAVHAGVAYTFGTKTKYWTVKPIVQSVSYAKVDSERRREDIFFSSMSAPVFSRATADLPRWIIEPDGKGYWSRWTSAYWLMSTTSLWVTMVGSWDAFAADDSDAGWDFNNARQAISDSKRDQVLFLSSLTALMSADVLLNWDDYRNNFQAFGGSKAVTGKKADEVSIRLMPQGLQMTLIF